MTKTAADVLKFWFEDHGPDDWFGARPEFDALVALQFSATLAALSAGEGWRWRTTPKGRLAEIIVLDQFPRQIFRGRAEAFSSDRMALTLAQEAVAGGYHNFLSPTPERMVLLLPYQHAESSLVQAESMRLHRALGAPEILSHAEGHAACIARFGRFPMRNAALGRLSTPEELDYIAGRDGHY